MTQITWLQLESHTSDRRRVATCHGQPAERVLQDAAESEPDSLLVVCPPGACFDIDPESELTRYASHLRDTLDLDAGAVFTFALDDYVRGARFTEWAVSTRALFTRKVRPEQGIAVVGSCMEKLLELPLPQSQGRDPALELIATLQARVGPGRTYHLRTPLIAPAAMARRAGYGQFMRRSLFDRRMRPAPILAKA